jgi:hypothetical protein
MKHKTILVFSFIIVLISFLFVTSSWADVVITGKMTVSGMMGMGTSESSMISKLKGDKFKSEGETKYKEGPMAQMPAKKELTIIRLDKGLLWQVDLEGKRYGEMGFDQIKQMLSSMQKTSLPDSLLPAWEVKKTGNKKKISGFNCEETQITFTTPGLNPMTGEKTDMEVLVSVWSTKGAKGFEEFKSFAKKMTEKIGISGSLAGLGMYGIDAKKLQNELDKIEGLEIKQTIIVNLKEAEKEEPKDTIQKAEHKPFIVIDDLTEKFEKATIPDSEFELPAGLKKEGE